MKELDEVDVLFYYGIPSENEIEDTKDWIANSSKKHIVFLEDDKKAFESFSSKFASLDFFQKMENVHLFYWDDDQQLEEFMRSFAWKTLFLSYKLLSAKDKELSKTKELRAFIDHMQNGVFLIGSDYSDFGIRSFSNVFANLHQQKEIFLLKDLQNSLKKKPAIICGAGPSLDAVMPLLKTLDDKALIFAGGSALGALAKNGVRPHFGSSVDKNASLDRFEAAEEIFDIPYFYQLSTSQEIFSKMTSKKNILVGGYGAYPLEAFIEKKLGIFQERLSFGWTVTTLMMQVAHFLGCDPIIVVGMDLSFEAEKDYASGIISQSHENPKRIQNENHSYTQKDWLMAKSWVEEFIKQTPDTTWINCSLGQWNKENLEDVGNSNSFSSQDFAQVIQDLSLNTKEKILSCLDGVLEKMSSKVLSEKEVTDLQKEIYESLINTQKLIQERLQQIEAFLFGGNKVALNEHTVLLLEQQLAVVTILNPLWKVFQPVMERDVDDPSLKGLLPENIHQEMLKILFYQQVIQEYLPILEEK